MQKAYRLITGHRRDGILIITGLRWGFLKECLTQIQFPYLSDDALYELVHGEGNVGVDGEHFPQLVLILRRLHVPIQEIAHHLQESRVVVFNVNVHWNRVTMRH